MQGTEMEVFLSLISKQEDTFDTGLVTEKLCLEPTEIRTMGQKISSGYSFPHTEWTLSFGKKELKEVEQALIDVFEIISEKAETMSRIAKLCRAEWNVLVYIAVRDEQKPIIYLSPKSIAILSSIDVHWGIDLYWL